MKTKITYKGENIVISLNSHIYTNSLIGKAIDTLKNHFDISYKYGKVVINNTDKKTALEFFNYLIDLKQNGNI
jgi:hypothetical protein